MRFIKSLYQSFKNAFLANEEVQKIRGRHPRTFIFLKKRLDKTKFSGFRFTILGLALLYVLILFASAIEGFINTEIIVSADVRVNTLLYVFRNALAVKTFIWITLLGESPTIVVFAFLVSVFLWLSQKKWQLVAFWLVIIGSETFTIIAKYIFHRARPVNAVFLESTNAFPSGHATIAVAFYGFLAYLLLKNTKHKFFRFIIVIVDIMVIGAIGFSRLYLGVHYVSDVWAGYLVGLIWLIIAIGLNEMKLFKKIIDFNKKYLFAKYRKTILGGLVSVALIFYICYGFWYHPKFLPKPAITAEATVTNAASIFTEYGLSRYSETLTGDTQEPISFIISAKDDASLMTGFERAGWSLAGPVNFQSSVELFRHSVSNKEYLTAPMTPSFWNKQVHDFGFQKSTETKSVRQRHHARFWKTNLKTIQGEIVYVGTVSLDTGIKWFITHKISPDIDTERDLLFNDLQNAGYVGNFEKVKLVSPILGKNFGGDQFFTNGEAYFIDFTH